MSYCPKCHAAATGNFCCVCGANLRPEKFDYVRARRAARKRLKERICTELYEHGVGGCYSIRMENGHGDVPVAYLTFDLLDLVWNYAEQTEAKYAGNPRGDRARLDDTKVNDAFVRRVEARAASAASTLVTVLGAFGCLRNNNVNTKIN